MGALSGVHWLIIAIVAAFLFFGWKQLPDMARSMGRSLRVFKTEIKGMTDDDKARDKNRDESESAEQPKQLAPRPAPAAAPVVEPRQAPRADVVRNTAAAPAPSAQGTRPRPAPRPQR